MRRKKVFSIILFLILTISTLLANSNLVIAFNTENNNFVTQSISINPPAVLWDKTYNDNISAIQNLGSNLNCMIQTNDGGYAMAGITSSNRVTNFLWFVKSDSLGNEQWVKYFGFNSAGSFADAFSVIQTADNGYALAGYRSGYPDNGGAWLVKIDSLGNQQWNKTYATTGTYQETFSLVQTVNGGYALAGIQNQYGVQGNQALLIRTDSLGNMLWNKTYGALYGATSLIETADGGFVMAGNATSTGTSGYGGFGLLKTDSSGNFQWNQTFGNANLRPNDFQFSSGFPQNGAPVSVVQTSDGAFAVLGTIGTSNGNRFELVKTDTQGNLTWNQIYGESNDNDIAASLIRDRDGGYALAGSKYNSSKNYFDFWLIKTDSLGNTEWNQTFERYGNLQYEALLQTLIQTSDNGYAVLGNVATDLSWLIKTAAPAPKTYAITVAQGVNGIISPDSNTVNYGSNQTFTIIPNAGYHTTDVIVDNVSQGPISSYIFTNVSTSHTITAMYAQTMVALTVNVGANGQSNIASGNVAWGLSEKFVFTPNTNYHVTDVMINGTIDHGTVSMLNLNITGPTTVAVAFAQTIWTITATQSAHGTISPATASYAQGSSQNEVITPDSGYNIASVTVDGNSLTVTTPSSQIVSFTNVQATHTITASFALIQTPTPTPSPTPTQTPPASSTPTPTSAPTESPASTTAPISATPTPDVSLSPTISPTIAPSQTPSPSQLQTTDPTFTSTAASSIPQGAIYGIVAVAATVGIVAAVLILSMVRKSKRETLRKSKKLEN
jgi:hypothetical protein